MQTPSTVPSRRNSSEFQIPQSILTVILTAIYWDSLRSLIRSQLKSRESVIEFKLETLMNDDWVQPSQTFIEQQIQANESKISGRIPLR